MGVCGRRRFTAATMPQRAGPARAHFGGEGGCVAVTKNNRTTHHWQYMYGDFKIGGKNWPAQKGRVHLSGDKGLASGICAKVCPNAPDNTKAKMRASSTSSARAGREYGCRSPSASAPLPWPGAWPLAWPSFASPCSCSPPYSHACRARASAHLRLDAVRAIGANYIMVPPVEPASGFGPGLRRTWNIGCWPQGGPIWTLRL